MKPKKKNKLLIRTVGFVTFPFITTLLAIVEAFYNDSILDFFPSIWNRVKREVLEYYAKWTFWPEAGWCWHYEEDKKCREPGGPWMTWNLRFVLHDPVERNELGWTWCLEDASYAVQKYVKAKREKEAQENVAQDIAKP